MPTVYAARGTTPSWPTRMQTNSQNSHSVRASSAETDLMWGDN